MRHARLLAALTGLAVLISACGPSRQGGVESVSRLHDVGVDPSDGRVYVAAHDGLYRIDDTGPSLIGDPLDVTSFDVAATGEFLAGGHSTRQDRWPPLLGLLSSSDQGRTWSTESLLSAADFHVLEVARDRVYGWNATSEKLMVSSDRRTWEDRSQLPMLDLAVNPSDPDQLLAATEDGLLRSDDAGGSWSRVEIEQRVALVAWPAEGPVAATDDGVVLVAQQDNAGWGPAGRLGDDPAAMTADGDLLYALAGGRLLRSDDHGGQWHAVADLWPAGRAWMSTPAALQEAVNSPSQEWYGDDRTAPGL